MLASRPRSLTVARAVLAAAGRWRCSAGRRGRDLLGPEPVPGVTRPAILVGNNWDGTTDIVDPDTFERLDRINVIPDKEEREAEIAFDARPARASTSPCASSSARATTSSTTTSSPPTTGSTDLRQPAEPRRRRRDRPGDQADQVARAGRRLPLRPHGDQRRRHATAGVGLHRQRRPRARHGDRRAHRRLRVRRLAARERLLQGRLHDLPRLDRPRVPADGPPAVDRLGLQGWRVLPGRRRQDARDQASGSS